MQRLTVINPMDLSACMFAIALRSGWLALLLEQLERAHLYRPKQIYVGDHGKIVAPIGDRTATVGAAR